MQAIPEDGGGLRFAANAGWLCSESTTVCTESRRVVQPRYSQLTACRFAYQLISDHGRCCAYDFGPARAAFVKCVALLCESYVDRAGRGRGCLLSCPETCTRTVSKAILSICCVALALPLLCVLPGEIAQRNAAHCSSAALSRLCTSPSHPNLTQ